MVILQQREGNQIALSGAGEPMMIMIIEIADYERCRTVVDFSKDKVSAKGESFGNALPALGPSRPDVSVPVCNPAIREVDYNVLIVGEGFEVEFASVDGHNKLWVQMIESDIPDGKARTYM